MNLGLHAIYWPVSWDKTQALPANGTLAGFNCAYTRNPPFVVLGDWATMDMWVSGLIAAGIQPCFIIDPALPNVVALVSQAVTRYRYKINFWEIGNEIETGQWYTNVSGLISLHNQIYPAIKSVAPEAAIMHGSVQGMQYVPGSDNSNLPGFRMLCKLFEWGCKTDFLNIHLYPTSVAVAAVQIAQMVSDLRAIGRAYGMPKHGVWATEVGVNQPTMKFSALPKTQQAIWMTTLLGAAKSAGVATALWYAWDSIAGPTEAQDFGFKGAGDQALWNELVVANG